MKLLTLMMIVFATQFHEIGKGDEGVMKASLVQEGEKYMLVVDPSNLIETESVVLYTSNSWKIRLEALEEGQDGYVINSIQASVLKEEEILNDEVEQRGESYWYKATDRSFFKNRIE